MTKYAGLVGYVTQTETSPGIWEPVVTEKRMRGDVLRLSSIYESSDKVNDDIVLQNRISVIADTYALANQYSLRYVTYQGVKWKVVGIDASQRPRLILTLGGVWNG